MILSSILERIGLMKRIACWSILKAGGGYKGIIYGFFGSGILMGLLVPSGAGKVALYATLAYGICKELKISPKSDVSSMIMLGGYFSAIGPLYLTGGGNNIIAFETAAKYGGMKVTWLSYFIQMGIPSIIFTFLLITAMLFIFKKDEPIFEEKNKHKTKEYFVNEYKKLGKLIPSIIFTFLLITAMLFIFKKDEPIFEEKNKHKTKEYFVNEYKKLGKFSAEEKKVSFILFLIVIGLLTGNIHNIAPGWIFVMGCCACYFPGIDVGQEMDIKNVKFHMIVVIGLLTGNIHNIAPGWIFVMGCCACYFPGIDVGQEMDIKNVKFHMIVFMASAMAIGNVSIATGAGNFAANHLYGLLSGGAFSVTGFVWLFGVLVNFILTPLAAVAGLTSPLLEAGVKAGQNPLPLLYSFLQGIEQILLPYENATVLFLFGYGLITMKNFFKGFGLRMVLNIIFILAICVPYWMALGLYEF